MNLALLAAFMRRFIGMVGGEAMQSAFHFALNISLAQIMSPHDYGVFAIIMVIGGVGLTYIRAFCAMPASIWIGRSRGLRAARSHDATFGAGALALSASIGAATALLLQFWIGSDAVVGGLFVALWCLRSYLRTAMFALGHQRETTIADALFTLTGASLAIALLSGGGDKLQMTLLALLAANAAGVAAALLLARRRLRLSFGRAVRRRYRRLWGQLGWSGLSVTTANFQGQGLSLLVAAFAGPAAYAPIAAGLVLFVPLRVIATALVNLMQPILASYVSRGDFAQMWRHAQAWTLLMGAGSFLYGLAMMVALPHIKARVFEGAPLQVIGFCCWAIYSASMLYVMPRLIMEAANGFRQIALITAAGAVVGMSLVSLSLLLAPPAWALLGALASELIVLIACWAELRKMFPPPAAAAMSPSFPPPKLEGLRQ